MKALIGVDGSPGSYGAVQFAGRVLSDCDDVLFYYSPPGGVAAGTLLNPVQSFLADAVFERARQHLPAALQKRAAHVACYREASQGIPLVALDRKCDLIVLGARGTGPVQQRALGAVSRHIVDHAKLPVLLVRCQEGRTAGPLRVLLASDGTATSRHAAEVLHRLTWPKSTTGITITVIESEHPQRLPEWLCERLDDQQLEQLGMGHFCCDPAKEMRLRQEAATWCGALPDIFAGNEPLVAVGHVAEAVLNAVAARDIDLVVVGARRLGPIQRLLLGSTSSQVAEHAPCSVLIVRGAEHHRAGQ